MDRIADHDIDPLFLNRWSPRAMSGEPLTEEELMRLLEAARWAPSAFNVQPWRFIYARAGTPYFSTLFNLLREGNRPWNERAGALVLVLSKTDTDDGKPVPTHSFDTGAAWENLALQAFMLGLVAHGMSGFDHERAQTELGIPPNYRPEAMIALGYRGKLEDLPERYRAREVKSGRRPLSELVFEGKFPGAGGR